MTRSGKCFTNVVTWKQGSEVLQEEACSNISRSLEMTGRLFYVLIYSEFKMER